MPFSRRALATASLLLFVFCGLPLFSHGQEASSRKPAPVPEQPSGEGSLEYHIGCGDVLQLVVWREPELSRDLMVRLDGRVTVPLIGDVTAAGHSPAELASEIGKLLKRFLTDPQVTVGVSQANSARFYVLGQVQRPGDFSLTGTPTVLQGLALAGGFKEFAKADSIVIIRREGKSERVIPFNYKKLAGGQALGQNLVLRPGDTILVP